MSPAILKITPEPSAIMDNSSVFPVIMDVAFEDRMSIPRCLRLASSLEDTPMTSVQAAGISGIMLSVGVLEVVTMSTIYPITGKRSTPKLTPVQESTPVPASVQEFTPELAPTQESVSEPAPFQDFVFEPA